MENNFENQIRAIFQKESIDPSPDVWDAVSKRLPNKKPNRRIAWLFVLAALFTSVAVWMVIGYMADGKQETVFSNSVSAPDETMEIQKGAADSSNAVPEIADETPKQTLTKLTGEPVVSVSPTFQMQPVIRPQTNIRDSQSVDNIESPSVLPETEMADKGKLKQAVQSPDSLPKVAEVSTDRRSDLTYADSTGNSAKETDQTPPSPSSLPAKRSRKWQTELHFSVAAGGIANSPFAAKRKDNFSPVYSGVIGNIYTGPGQAYTPFGDPARPENSVVLSAGLQASKTLTASTSFYTGLTYQLYTNSMMIGSRLPDGRYASRGLMSSHRNQYHFIEVPAGLDMPVLRKKNIPVRLQAGLTFSQLLMADNVHYESGLYEKTANFLTHFQVGAEVGLRAVILQRVTVGPFYQHRVTSFGSQGIYANKALHFGGLRMGYRFGNPGK